MIASAPTRTRPRVLPLPEHLQGHGLAECLEVIRPQIETARSHVRDAAHRLAGSPASAPFDPASIEASLARNLAEPLLTMMTRVMVLELNVARLEDRLVGATPQERFRSFLDSFSSPDTVAQLFDEYNVLWDQIVNRLDRWAAFSIEFLEHLCADWPEIHERLLPVDPGMLVHAESGAGDVHRGGRSVIIASFSSGAKLVYKPRSLAVDEHFHQLLSWINGVGVEPPFRPPRILNCGDHGWGEFISAAPCSSAAEVLRFYRRQGGYLALLYALEASDFHCENLIAMGEHPMLIDLEALCHPHLDDLDATRAEELAGGALGYSVLRVGLLPARMWGDDEHPGVDMSGLGSAAGQLLPQAVPHWEQADTDEMHVVRKQIRMPAANNRPAWNGKEANAFDYSSHVAEGFASTYRALLQHRGEFLALVRRFSGDEVRVIVRPTRTYGTLLHESFHPDVLRGSADRTALLDRLRPAGEDPRGLSRLVPFECGDLLAGDVPLFTTRPASQSLWTSTGERLDHYFAETGLALVERRIAQLSESDLERQLWIVRASLATLAPAGQQAAAWDARVSRSESAAAGPDFLAAACSVADRLQELAFTGASDASWIGLSLLRHGESTLAPLGPDLYDGLPGVILFLAYLAEVTREDRYLRLAMSAWNTLRWQVQQNQALRIIGAFTGWGGVLYTLAHLGRLWADASLWDQAESLAQSIPDLAARDQQYDVVGGAAGCLLALAALYRVRPSKTVLEAARACGDRLLATARPQKDGIGWICDQIAPVPLTGFAHGNAGIAAALLELTRLTSDSRYEDAARAALRYEHALFSRAQNNWPDLREIRISDFAAAWCHGAPGIALSRLRSLPLLDDAETREEIRVALETTLRLGFGTNHTLCHGDLGNLEILHYAAQVLGDPGWLAQSRQIGAEIVATARQTGWICGNAAKLESPGLMTGLAGIGYALLRLAEPSRVPSLLPLAPPLPV